ncbi:FG-GAP-like repeat-containing protein, partial [Polaribacter glomeratus]
MFKKITLILVSFLFAITATFSNNDSFFYENDIFTVIKKSIENNRVTAFSSKVESEELSFFIQDSEFSSFIRRAAANNATLTLNSVASSNSVLVDAPATITSFSPLSGDVGETLTITGTNFNTTPANNIVFFGATSAVVSAATATSLTVTVPSGATYAPITVLNTETILAVYSRIHFNPTFTPNNENITSNDFDNSLGFSVGTQPGGVSIGDIDGDGKPDLIVCNFNANTLSILRNTGNPGTISFADKIDISVSGQPRNVAIGDIDGDGKLDIAASSHYGSGVSIYLNTSTLGNVSFGNRVDVLSASSSPNGMTYWVELSDIDSDGKLDIVYALGRQNLVGIQKNTSSLGVVSFGPEITFGSSNGTYNLAVGDIDGDGKPDIAVTASNLDKVSLLRNTTTSGSISFEPQVLIVTTSRSTPVKLADMDGDGKLDLIANPSIFRNTSVSGSFSFDTRLDLPHNGFFEIGDIDGDGKPDFVQSHNTYSNASVRRNTSTIGSLSFDAATIFSGNTYPNGIVLGDMDGDGKTDVVITNFASSSVSVTRNNPVSPLSNNANLSALTTTAGALNPIFATSTLEYTTADVSNATTSITVTPTTADANATITVNGTTVNSGAASDALALSDGLNTITIIVTAEDASTKTYSLTVNRQEPINNNIISENQTVCAGDDFAILTGSVAEGGDGSNYTYLWESSTTGLINEFTPASGTNNTNNYSPAGLTQTTWYRRTVTSGTLTDTSENVELIVKPLVTVDQPENILADSGTSIDAISFSGTAQGYTWTNSQPGIGLASSGTGSIPSFMAANTTGGPIVATITVTPKDAAYAYIANFQSNDVSVINTLSDVVITTIPVGTLPSNVAANPNGSAVYVVNKQSNNISVISTATNTVTATIALTNPTSSTVSPDGSTLYVCYNINKVAIISTATNLVTRTITLPSSGYAQGIITSPDGSKLYIANTSDFKVVVYETINYNLLANIPCQVSPAHLSITPDGSTVYVTNAQSKSVSVINTATNTVITTIGVGGLYPGSNCMSPDGKTLYVANSQGNFVSVINTATNRVTKNISVASPYGLSLTPDGAKLYVNNRGNGVVVINTKTEAVVGTITVGSLPVSEGGNFISQTQGCPGSSKTFTITINDATDPVITTTAIVADINEGLTALGSVSADEDVTWSITGTGVGIDVDGIITLDAAAVAGTTYTFTITATDGSGNETLTSEFSITVNDITIPEITLTGANPQVLEVEDAYTELNAAATDNYDDNTTLTGTIVIDDSAVIAGTIGSYIVTYNVTDANGNEAVEVERTVH